MKRQLLVVALITVIAASAPAFDISAGAGVNGGYSWWNYSYDYTGLTTVHTITELPLTFSCFFDVTYAELSAGYAMVNGYSQKDAATGFPTTTTALKEDYRWISFRALLRYPFRLGEVSVFPLAGVEYDWNLSYTDSTGKDLKAFLTADQKANLDQLWIKAGIGADFSFGRFYLRPQLLAGYKLLSKLENDVISMDRAGGETNVSVTSLVFSGGLLAGFRF